MNGERERQMKITKITVNCEVAKSANYQSARCTLGCEAEVKDGEDVGKLYNVIYDKLYDRCIASIDRAIARSQNDKE